MRRLSELLPRTWIEVGQVFSGLFLRNLFRGLFKLLLPIFLAPQAMGRVRGSHRQQRPVEDVPVRRFRLLQRHGRPRAVFGTLGAAVRRLAATEVDLDTLSWLDRTIAPSFSRT